MAIMRKKSVNVLKHLIKLADDLDTIADLEGQDKEKARQQVFNLENKIKEHQKEIDLATQVSISNIHFLHTA